MSARKGSLTVTRYFPKQAPPKDLRQRASRSIRLRAFRPLEPQSEANEASGWCVLGQPFDLELDTGKLFNDQLLLLGLRIDRYRIPSSLLQAKLHEEQQRSLARTGKPKLSKHERAELKQTVTARLRKTVVPATRAVDMVWDLQRNVVLFFSHAARTLLEFTALFEKTFGLELAEDSPYLAAQRAALPKALIEQLGKVEALHLSAARKALARTAALEPAPVDEEVEEPERDPRPTSVEELPELARQVEGTRFLGAELLVWVWLRGELLTGGLRLGAHQEWSVWLDKHLAFESPLDKNERVTVHGAAPTDAHEAREALRARKFPVRGHVMLQSVERDWAFDLLAGRFAVANAQVPAVLRQDPEEALLERIELMHQLLATLDALFGQFLRTRLSARWTKAWEPALAAWVQDQPVPAALVTQLEGVPPARAVRARASSRVQDATSSS